MKDGALLDRLDLEGGTVLLTCDRNMSFQQTLAGRNVALVVLPGQRLAGLASIITAIADAVANAKPGTVTTIDTQPPLSTSGR
jgi:hypothetical protein